MHHRRHSHGRGFGRGFGQLGARWYAREHVLERLEGYRRDLEQELADVSDLIRRLQAGDEPAGEAQPQGA